MATFARAAYQKAWTEQMGEDAPRVGGASRFWFTPEKYQDGGAQRWGWRGSIHGLNSEYKVDKVLSDRRTAIYYNKDINTVVIAFRGSVDAYDWIATDFKWMVGPIANATKRLPGIGSGMYLDDERMYKAVKEKYPTAKIVTSGHSLGGTRATVIGKRHEIPSWSFNGGNSPFDLQKIYDSQTCKWSDVVSGKVRYDDLPTHCRLQHYVSNTNDYVSIGDQWLEANNPNFTSIDNPLPPNISIKANFALGHKIGNLKPGPQDKAFLNGANCNRQAILEGWRYQKYNAEGKLEWVDGRPVNEVKFADRDALMQFCI